MKEAFGAKYFLSLLSNYLHLFINGLTNFILIPFMLKHMGKHEMGVFFMFNNVAQYLTFGAGWIGGVATRFIGISRKKSDTVSLSNSVSLSFFYFLIYGLAVSLAFLISILFVGGAKTKIALLIFASFLLINYLFQFFIIIYYSFNDQLKQNALRTFQIVIYLLSAIYLTVKLESYLAPLLGLLISVLTSLLLAILLGKEIIKLLSLKFLRDKEFIKDFFSKGGWNFLYGFFLLTLFLDSLFLGFFLSPEYVSRFVVIWQIPNFFYLLMFRFSSVAIPFFIEQEANEERHRKMFFLLIVIVGFTSLVFLLIYGLLGNRILSFWIGDMEDFPQYYFWIAGFVSTLLSAERVFVSFLISAGRFKELSVLGGSICFIKYILSFLFLEELREVSTITAYSIALITALPVYILLIKRRSVKHESKP